MQYDVRTPDEYLAALDDDWRRQKLVQVRARILEQAPGITEDIAYKMLRYGGETNGLFGLNAQKHYVSLYVGDASKVDPGGTILKGVDCGKGCIRIKKTTDLDTSGILSFIDRAVAIWREGAETGC